jgi:hypothetical protein
VIFCERRGLKNETLEKNTLCHSSGAALLHLELNEASYLFVDCFLPLLQLVAHAVNLLDVRKHHLGVNPLVPDHSLHVVGGQEVGDAGITPESSYETL